MSPRRPPSSPAAAPFRGARGAGCLALVAAAVAAASCGRDTIELSVSAVRVDAGSDAGADATTNLDGGGADGGLETIACTVDGECASRGGVCAATLGHCVECEVDAQCGPRRSRCEPTSHRCVGCLSSSDCFPIGLVCDSLTWSCEFACTSSSGCFGRICDETRGVCVSCESDEQCRSVPFIGIGDPKCVLGICVQCLSDADCGGDAPFCEQRFGRCVECVQSEQCAAGMVCDFTRRCVASDPNGGGPRP